MKKNSFLVLFAMSLFAGKSIGQTVQPCNTFEMLQTYKQQHPEIIGIEKQLEAETINYLSKHGSSARSKTTSVHHDTDWYDIPVVVHIMHDNGAEIIPDYKVYELIKEMNRFYSLQYDYSAVIPAFKKYVGKAKIRFHLATKDPNGNRTKGITHRTTYLTYGGDDQCKMDQWSPTNYINIWFIQRIGAQIVGGIIVAYATQPPSAGAWPFSDGIISNYGFIGDYTTNSAGAQAGGGSIDHEMGHVLNLDHTFGKSNNPHTNFTGSCSDDDDVDDTPPTEGNLGGCSLWDSVCATNYYKVYPDIHGADSLADYPDTSNEQNIMNYADCKVMFTKGQVERMRAALNSDIGGRSNLWDSVNLVNTGALDSTLDLKPIPAFYSAYGSARQQYFTCPNTKLRFFNRSYGDTVTKIVWNFTNGASTPTYTATSTLTTGIPYSGAVGTGTSGNASNIDVSFTTPGWATVSMTCTGNHTGDTTATWDHSVFVADAAGTSGNSIVEEFSASGDLAKWPIFNYYNNEFKWQASTSVGLFDNTSMMYAGFDNRIIPGAYYPPTGSPMGDYDDFFSIPVDLTSMASGKCNLNFWTSGASRSSGSLDITDTMFISYSIDGAKTFVNMDTLTKSSLINKGSVATSYVPTSGADWVARTKNVPTAARQNYVVFRFRYKPGVDHYGYKQSTGNNFYMDRLTFSPYPAAVSGLSTNPLDVIVAPNPTSNNAYVIVKDADNATAHIIVSDITGKVVYTTTQEISGTEARIEIPASAISVKGVYMVQATTGHQSSTQKLVVY